MFSNSTFLYIFRFFKIRSMNPMVVVLYFFGYIMDLMWKHYNGFKLLSYIIQSKAYVSLFFLTCFFALHSFMSLSTLAFTRA